MQTPLPLVQDLCLIGGGHAHALVLRMWGMDPLPGVRLTVINPDPVAPYTGMLPGYVAGHYARDDMMIDLVPLARFAGARLILDRATGIEEGQVKLAGRPPIGFDVASVNVGITSDLPDLPGFNGFGHAAKPLNSFADQWEAFVETAGPTPQVVVIGGGVAGVELALACAHRLGRGTMTIVERGSDILPLLGAASRRRLGKALEEAGIQVITDTSPVALTEGAVTLANGQVLPSDFTLSAAGARPPVWLAGMGLDLHDGFLAVAPTLQTSQPNIFATGDCAHMTQSPRPKAGVFAVRQAPVLMHNLKVALSERGLMKAYKPQKDYLKLVSMGGKTALADKFGIAFAGHRMWNWKDRIDQRFMSRLTDLPAMKPPVLPDPSASGLALAIGDQPFCAGCGAKVGAGALAGALADLPPHRRADVLSGPGDDAAVLQAGQGVQVITTDHLRAVTEDPFLMARIAAVHALGDVWAMGATPQGALAQIILPRLSPALQGRTLAEIMAAASEVFGSAGADIIGGHTSIGDALTIGFTVTGLAPSVIAKSGAQPGDALILTKAIGSGTILAAVMADIHPKDLKLGEAWAATQASMTRLMSDDAAILAPLAHAMTDVTGFGLAGHLLEMLRASACAARVSLSALPILPGAESLAAKGVASTLAPDNRAATVWDMSFAETPRAALTFDPQTCGGLLAAVPARQADKLLSALQEKGVPAQRIGTVMKGKPHLTLTA